MTLLEAAWTFFTCWIVPVLFGVGTVASILLGAASLTYAKTDKQYSTLAVALFLIAGLCLAFYPCRSVVASCRHAVLVKSENAAEREEVRANATDNGVAACLVVAGIAAARALHRYDPQYIGMFCTVWGFHAFCLLRTIHAVCSA